MDKIISSRVIKSTAVLTECITDVYIECVWMCDLLIWFLEFCNDYSKK